MQDIIGKTPSQEYCHKTFKDKTHQLHRINFDSLIYRLKLVAVRDVARKIKVQWKKINKFRRVLNMYHGN